MTTDQLIILAAIITMLGLVWAAYEIRCRLTPRDAAPSHARRVSKGLDIDTASAPPRNATR
jgi:hypothetical protein